MKSFILVSCAVLAVTGTAAAQDSAQNPPAAPCQAQPQDGRKPPATTDSGDATETLAPCGGVLQPPPSGDQGMTQPPPDQGNTPVIKPGDMPVRPPKP